MQKTLGYYLRLTEDERGEMEKAAKMANLPIAKVIRLAVSEFIANHAPAEVPAMKQEAKEGA